MGFKKNWDVIDIVSQINIMAMECKSPYNEGFLAWGIKQDLLRVKWLVDDALNRCPKFAGEDEFVEKHEQDLTLQILKRN